MPFLKNISMYSVVRREHAADGRLKAFGGRGNVCHSFLLHERFFRKVSDAARRFPDLSRIHFSLRVSSTVSSFEIALQCDQIW